MFQYLCVCVPHNTNRTVDILQKFVSAYILHAQAYAKAHGSYHAISGGHVREAMLDLTGAPTETIWMDHPEFDSEVTWARLLSFAQEGFPMGCASDSGYVG